MALSILSQALYYLPSVLAHLLAFAAAAALFSRARLAAGLLAAGTLLQLVASATSFSLNIATQLAYMEGWGSEVSAVSGVLGLVASLIRAVGEVGVVAAVVAAVTGAGSPARAAVDAYGFAVKP